MKRICFLFGIFLLLGMAHSAQAACAPEDCVTDPCLKVRLAASPETVCPGDTITVSGSIENLMACGDVFVVKVRYNFFDDVLAEKTKVNARRNWMRPKIIIPLRSSAKFKFAYETKIPRKVPPGEYIIGISAEGINSGVAAKAKTRFVVEGCGSGKCDDGSPWICDMLPPQCNEFEILALQNGCWICVNPATCKPWGEPGCSEDKDCPPGTLCDFCGTSSCPYCDDCIPACVPEQN